MTSPSPKGRQAVSVANWQQTSKNRTASEGGSERHTDSFPRQIPGGNRGETRQGTRRGQTQPVGLSQERRDTGTEDQSMSGFSFVFLDRSREKDIQKIKEQ